MNEVNRQTAPEGIPEAYMMILRQSVEKKVSFAVATSRDFELLSEAVSASGAGYISSSTLKRIWGYVRDTPRKHTATLDVLARFAGFAGGFADFLRRCEADSESESGYTSGRALDMTSLPVGSMVKVAWMPDREIVLRCENEGGLFEIVRALNSKLKVGMKVRCGRLVEGRALILDLLVGSGRTPLVYEAGKVHGVTWDRLTS